jgi:hypothetical protein
MMRPAPLSACIVVHPRSDRRRVSRRNLSQRREAASGLHRAAVVAPPSRRLAPDSVISMARRCGCFSESARAPRVPRTRTAAKNRAERPPEDDAWLRQATRRVTSIPLKRDADRNRQCHCACCGRLSHSQPAMHVGAGWESGGYGSPKPRPATENR